MAATRPPISVIHGHGHPAPLIIDDPSPETRDKSPHEREQLQTWYEEHFGKPPSRPWYHDDLTQTLLDAKYTGQATSKSPPTGRVG